MALRYRVGTGGNWNSTTYWSASSGGGSGASVPGSADDAIFDTSTPTGTVTIDVAVDIVNLTCTGWAGTLDQAGYTMQISGNWTVPTGMTFTHNGLVQFDGSGASQTVTMDASANSFDDLQNSITHSSTYDLVWGSDIRTTGVFTIDINCRVNSNSGGSYTTYIRGSGSGMLVLNGWMYALSRTVIFEINGGGTTYIPGAIGWNVNGSLTGAVLRIEIISTITSTIRLAGDISEILIFNIRSTTAGSGATVAFYTDNYDIIASVAVSIGPDAVADACAFTSYWGSSLIHFTNNATQTFRFQWDAATHNLQSATFRGMTDGNGGMFSVYGPSTGAVDTAQTFSVGTSTVLCRYVGESWMGLGAHDGVAECYDMVLSNPGGTAYIYIKPIVTNKLSLADNGSSLETSVECQYVIDVNKLEINYVYSGGGFEFYEVGTSYVDTFDLNGSSGFPVNIRSRVPTSQATVQLANDAIVTYLDVQDSNLIGAVVNALDASNTDSGNNSPKWVFAERSQLFMTTYRRHRV